jgi:hypothetical protein
MVALTGLTFQNSPGIDLAAQESLLLASTERLPFSPAGVESSDVELAQCVSATSLGAESQTWIDAVRIGYDDGFVIASDQARELRPAESPYLLRINGWGQFRHAVLDSAGPNPDVNQFQLARARLVFSGNAIVPDLTYFVQLDGRSGSGDVARLLDYYLQYDLGHGLWGLSRGALQFRAGKYKVPVTMARELSGREFEFADRSVASTFFDVNRSVGVGLYGRIDALPIPLHWETSIFNGLITGGAETGSSGALDDNFAYSGRIYAYPNGEWGTGALADFDWHERLATRVGAGFASSTIDRSGSTEFESIRAVDAGLRLSELLPRSVNQYDAQYYCMDASCKLRGWSMTMEYYFRTIDDLHGSNVSNLFDHGFWFQTGKFIIPRKLQLISRWSRVQGDSGSLGRDDRSSDEVAGGMVWYFRDQHAKLTFDVTHLNGAPIDSRALGISPGDIGWLYRTQLQVAF